jgi:dolichyl-phosphate beta-glucosyltransferase
MATAVLTAVIPAFNEGSRLPAFLQAWAAESLRRPTPTAAFVVDDGSSEAHATRHREGVEAAANMLRMAEVPHTITYVPQPRNEGKGASIRHGWRLADPAGTWLSFIDADGAVPAGEYWRLADRLVDAPPFDVLCGSRVKMAGRSVERSLFRHLQGRTFATAVEELFHLGFYDTQCGVKFFRASLVRPILADLQESRWLLDIELLALLRAAGARFVEAPIDCHERGGSAIVFGLDPIKMAVRLFTLRARLRREGRTG